MSLDPALQARIQSLLDSNRVVLFMKGAPGAPQCGFSAKAVAALDATQVEYQHVDVLSDPDIREGIKVYGQWPTIPQLYIGGELVGGSDIIEQMANSGELHSALGLPAPDRTPPTITITPAAAKVLGESIDNAGSGYVLQVSVDAQFNAQLQLAPVDAHAIATTSEGIRAQFDLASARRADGLRIDWVDDDRGRGLVIENPNAPAKVRELSPTDAIARLRDDSLVLVDVRPPDERAQAPVPAKFETLDDGTAHLEALPRDTALAFLCHHDGRSAQVAEHFRQLGFTQVYNISGGIAAWAEVDSSVPRY